MAQDATTHRGSRESVCVREREREREKRPVRVNQPHQRPSYQRRTDNTRHVFVLTPHATYSRLPTHTTFSCREGLLRKRRRTTQLPRENMAKSKPLVVTLSVGTPLCTHGIAYHRVYGSSTCGLFKKSVWSALCGSGWSKGS